MCCAGSRLLVQESVYEDVIRKLKRRMGTLRVGDPLDKNTDIGAINSRQQLDKITELVKAGEEEGAEIYQPPCRLPERGYWFAPTVFTEVAQSYRIAQEEIFGPVLSVLTFRTPDEAVEKANNTPYGLSAGVWTDKGSRILWMAERLRAGVVWANTFNRFDPASPFGGYKESGFGREGGCTGSSRTGLRRRPLASRSHSTDARRGCPSRRRTSSTSGESFRAPSPGARYEVEGQNVACASRKDLRDAVRAARAAFPGWAGRTAYNRGQILYRVAEMMEARRTDLAAVSTGATEVDEAIDRMVWYAGWADKLAQALGSSNSVAGPYFNFTVPEPTGVVGILCPDEPPLSGIVTRLAPAMVGGNTVVCCRLGAPPAGCGRACGGARDLGFAGRRGQHPHRREDRARAVARRAHGRECDRPLGRRWRCYGARAHGRRERQARRARRADRPEPVGDRVVSRAEDGLAPDRALSGAPSYYDLRAWPTGVA